MYISPFNSYWIINMYREKEKLSKLIIKHLEKGNELYKKLKVISKGDI